VETEEGSAEEIMCNNKKSLIYLANQGAISFHPWLSCKKDLYRPDKVVFDLDPSGSASFAEVKKAARIVGEHLGAGGIEASPMTTGKSGIHVYYGIKPEKDFDQIRTASREMAEQLVKEYPAIFTVEMRKNKRGDKIFLDYLRNSYAQTSVCPYSLRPTQTAGVATPISWKELDKVRSGHHYTFRNIFRRLGAKGK
jgi:bifunctional non-homologous end joining protein LigD